MNQASPIPTYTYAFTVFNEEIATLTEELIEIKRIRAQREDEKIELLKENEELRKKTINGYIERFFNWIIKKGN